MAFVNTEDTQMTMRKMTVRDMLTRCEVMLEYLTEEVVLSLMLLFVLLSTFVSFYRNNHQFLSFLS